MCLHRHTSGVWNVTFSPDGRCLASAGVDRTVRLWDAETGQEVLTLTGHADAAYCAVFSPDGGWLASASEDGTIKLWDARPWGPEVAVEREARGLVQRLIKLGVGKAEAETLLRDDRFIRKPVRQKALAWLGVDTTAASTGYPR
jgi:hypothetical protein